MLKVIIEEVICRTVFVEEGNEEKIPELYKEGEFEGEYECQQASYLVEYEDGTTTNWIEIK